MEAVMAVGGGMAAGVGENLAAKGRKAVEDAKLKESCRQFEAVLWRDVLGRAMGETQGEADKTGTYNYMVGSTLADAVSGSKGGFSNILHAQLAGQANKQTKEKE